MTGFKLFVVCLAVCAVANRVAGNSQRPPASTQSDLVCRQMTPSPNFHGSSQSDNDGFMLEISPSMTEVPDGYSYVRDTEYTSTYEIKLIE